MSGDILKSTDWRYLNEDQESQANLPGGVRQGLGRRVLSHWKAILGATILGAALMQTPVGGMIQNGIKGWNSLEDADSNVNQGHDKIIHIEDDKDSQQFIPDATLPPEK